MRSKYFFSVTNCITISIVLIILVGLVVVWNKVSSVKAQYNEYSVKTEEAWVQKILEIKYNVSYPQSRIAAHVISDAARTEKVGSTVLMAIIEIESAYRGGAIGKHGEIGFMQLKEKYWKKECREYNIKDKYENIYAGACALRWVMDRTNNTDDALIAYNIGLSDFDNRVDMFRGFSYRDKVLKEVEEILETETQ